MRHFTFCRFPMASPASYPRRGLNSLGFSLVEVLVAGVVGAVIATTIPVMSNLSSRVAYQSRDKESAQSYIDSDIELIREKMKAYTWCSGSGSIDPCDAAVDPQMGENYYTGTSIENAAASAESVANSTANGNAAGFSGLGSSQGKSAVAKFVNACKDTQSTSKNELLANLITTISATKADLPIPTGFSRRVEVQDGTAKLIKITYTGPENFQRSVLMSPTVASMCPPA